MTLLTQLTDRVAVQEAIDEFVALGRTVSPLVMDSISHVTTGCGILGRVWAATSRRLPALRPASSTQTSERFSGDEATVVPALTALGCSIIIRIGENEVVAMVVNYFEVLHAQSQGGLTTRTHGGLAQAGVSLALTIPDSFLSACRSTENDDIRSAWSNRTGLMVCH